MKNLPILGVVAGLSLAASASAQQPAAAPADYHAMVTKYCVTCHNEKLNLPASNPLHLDKADLDRVAADPATWERVVRKLGVGAMPPQGSPRPDAATLEGFRTWLATTLDRAAAANPNPGRFVLHRLNRAEYANAIRDLLALDVDVKELLPPDSSDYGFDNIATILKTSPTLLERYLTAAIRIGDLAVGDRTVEPVAAVFPLRVDFTQWSHIEGLPLGTRGGQLVRYNFPADGEYVLYGRLFRTLDNDDSGVEGQDSPQPFEISIDGVRALLTRIGGPESDEAGWRNLGGTADATAERMKVRLKVKAGPHDVGFTFIQRAARSQELLEPLLRASQDGHMGGGEPAKLKDVIIDGPYNVTGVGDTPSRRRIFTCRPKSQNDEARCAREILSTIARRAYRRPVTDADLESPMAFYAKARQAADFEAGIRGALPRILASPSFLFRTEEDPAAATATGPHKVTDLELASRLSFFLWSSIPDDELLNLAAQGKLRDPGVLDRQVKRMIADKRADALVTNFTGQWLFLRNLEKMAPDLLQFPQFDDNLRQSFRRETEMFFASIMRDDRSALDLLNADYTFVNERLARHYGIPRVYGEQFRRVTLTDPNRRGLLGQGSILLLTSVATRTSPVIRGKWILTNLLNTPPPPPPPNVPPLDDPSGAPAAPKSVREKLEAHRKNPVCASCHKNMDPIGFALENFDATGQWRTTDAGTPIDASGTLVDGTAVDGPVALRQALLNRPDVFVGTLTEKLLTYALGRGLEPYDMPVVRGIAADAARNDYRFTSIVAGIVQSVPFQMRMRFEEINKKVE
jgi:mono/diheme cytochrome c family protein